MSIKHKVELNDIEVILITNSLNDSYNNAIKTLTEKGDNIGIIEQSLLGQQIQLLLPLIEKMDKVE